MTKPICCDDYLYGGPHHRTCEVGRSTHPSVLRYIKWLEGRIVELEQSVRVLEFEQRRHRPMR